MKSYFEFFGIEEAFNIDESALKREFIKNSKKYHPDFHTLHDQAEQERMLELSTLNNEAWKVLKDLQKRTAHILKLHDMMPEEGKAQVPQEFLMEMMDINEALMELEFDDNIEVRSRINDSIAAITNVIRKASQAAMDAWDEDREKGFLEAIRDGYLKQKYITRLKERL